MSLWKWFFSIIIVQMIWTKQSCPPIEELFFGIQQFSQEFTLRYLLCSRSVQKMSKKEKKFENIKQHWLSYPLFICALVEFFWSPENLQFLWFSIFLMCLLVSVCFVWCWIYLWDHLTNNWHFRAYIIKGFCDGWGGGGSFIIVICLFFHLLVLFFLWFI